MNSEIEATFLQVDHDALRELLKELGAECAQSPQFMRRTIFDYEDMRLDKKAAWIRVRDENDKVTMAFKHRQTETAEGMKEVEFTVGSYNDACTFMVAIGLEVKAVQETRREVWRLDDCEIMLDEWPWIPPYAEVEGPSEASVLAVSEKLGFDYGAAIFDSADAIYQRYFDVSRTEISTVPIAFGPIPDWLEKRRRT